MNGECKEKEASIAERLLERAGANRSMSYSILGDLTSLRDNLLGPIISETKNPEEKKEVESTVTGRLMEELNRCRDNLAHIAALLGCLRKELYIEELTKLNKG